MESALPTQDDVRRLQADPNVPARLSLAKKLGNSYARRLFGQAERVLADDIVRAIARDVEVEVRQALATTIAASADLPMDVAVQLAHDVVDVAEPILKESDLLGDDVLVSIVKSRSEDHRRLIAARRSVSETVSAAIIAKGQVPSVSTLVTNEGARINEPSLDHAVDRFGEEASVMTPLADRKVLPLAIAERLVTLVSERLKAQFAGRSARVERYAEGLGAQITEGAALMLGGGEAETLDLLALVDQLQAAGRLQPSLVIRAGRAGEQELMHAAVSRLTGQKFTAVREAFADKNTARRMLTDVGLVSAEIDEVLTSHAA